MRRAVAALATVVIWSVGLYAQAQAPAPPKPGPEHQRLAALVGNWTFDGEMKPGPMGPGGKITGTDRITWMAGGFFVERRFSGKAAGLGEMSGVEIMGYDAAKKVYTYNVFDSTGAASSGTYTINGSTWTGTGVGSMGGQSMQERCTLGFGAGNTTLSVKCEVSMDGKKWIPFVEGTSTKGK
jgi:hypothetical protein